MVDTARESRLHDRLMQFLQDHPEAHSTCLLVETPDFSWKGAAGLSDPEHKIPMTPDDRIYTASVAKTFTSTVALRLMEDGVLKLDERLPAYLPHKLLDGLHRFEGTSYDEQITVRHLLSHTSGLPDSFGSPGFMERIMSDPNRLWKPEETVDFIKTECKPHFRPGEGFNYYDVNYNLVGLVIESITGASLDDAYRRYIYEPLGLQDTYRRFVESPRSDGPGREAHVFHGDVDFTEWRALTADWAGGGLNSTLDDLNRFVRALARNEVFHHPETRETMFDWRPWMAHASYGLGVMQIDLDRAEDVTEHGLGQFWGHIGATGCFMFYWPIADASLCGTFNQTECERQIFPFVIDLLRMLRPA